MLSREEWAELKLREAEQADGTPIPGKKASAVRLGDKVYKAFEPQPTSDWKNPNDVEVDTSFELPTIVKRAPNIRADALGGRLWQAALKDPVQMKLLLQRVQGEFWKQGRTVAYDDIKRVADELIAVAEKREKEKWSKVVSH